ncbi:MAG: OmpA family protein [Gammaproteobacteria bacterium]|nr:OmpA family protein [Gammaproteobacteria bacterium]
MNLKKLMQIMVVCGGVAALSACSHLQHNGQSANGDDTSGSVQASGAGDGDSISDNDNAGSQSASAKRIYYFSFDKSDIRPQDKSAILANANYLVNHPNSRIILEGHTDPRGSREYNVALGERRANAVFDLLKSRGVNANQVRVVSYGQEKLAAPGRTEQDYQLDRRAVIVIAEK